MVDLSPQAQAVMIAAYALRLKNGQPNIAAALRAAADGWRAEVDGVTRTDFIRGILQAAEALDEIAEDLQGQYHE